MAQLEFHPGFRLSGVDIVILLAAALLTWFAGRKLWWAGLCVAYVTAHFFLFCNVVRLSRSLELCWSANFLVLALTTIQTNWPGWPTTIACSLFTTCGVVAIELQKPSYHGILWSRINPDLQSWWNEQQANLDRSAERVTCTEETTSLNS